MKHSTNTVRKIADDRDRLQLRRPNQEDGAAVNALIARCKPLDENSLYCNLLQCTHFRETSALAELDGEVVGFVSGYLKPEAPDSLFIWQVAVAPEARGMTLAKRLMLDILHRPAARNVRHVQTTITGDNQASHGVFSSLARSLGAGVARAPLFDSDQHLDGQHKTEVLWQIGPFKRADIMPALAEFAA